QPPTPKKKKNFVQQVKPKKVFLPSGNNKSTFQPEGAAPAASSLKSSYIKNEEKLSKERGTLNSDTNEEQIIGVAILMSFLWR
ncbi:MAG: hypothetical protein K5901_00325, partial [Bacteroidales bacterium]|nr:hypothetical protein [Bacteroidales bacterium]